MSFKLKFPSILKGCVLHIPLDEESYNPATRRFTDKSAYGNHGISANAANFAVDRKGRVNRAEVFNGIDDYVACGDPGFTDNSFTLGAWWNHTANTSRWAAVVSTLKHASPSAGIQFAPDSEYRFSITHGVSGTSDTYFQINQSYDFNQWYHTMLTYDGTTLKTYFNSQEIDSRNIAAIPKSIKSRIGRWSENDGYYFNGSIADVWIHNRALTESERTFMYESYRPKVII
jgi:hypothetical protein